MSLTFQKSPKAWKGKNGNHSWSTLARWVDDKMTRWQDYRMTTTHSTHTWLHLEAHERASLDKPGNDFVRRRKTFWGILSNRSDFDKSERIKPLWGHFCRELSTITSLCLSGCAERKPGKFLSHLLNIVSNVFKVSQLVIITLTNMEKMSPLTLIATNMWSFSRTPA